LIIFFAVSTTFRVYPGLSVNLPEAKADKVVEEKKSLTAILTEKGDLYLEEEAVSLDHLPKALRVRQEMSPIQVFVLQADERVHHGKVVRVMDAARQAGISRLAIGTREPAKDR